MDQATLAFFRDVFRMLRINAAPVIQVAIWTPTSTLEQTLLVRTTQQDFFVSVPMGWLMPEKPVQHSVQLELTKEGAAS